MKTYLGDSVYCEIDENNSVILTTENGFGPSNTIILEEEVLGPLLTQLEKHFQFEITPQDPESKARRARWEAEILTRTSGVQ